MILGQGIARGRGGTGDSAGADNLAGHRLGTGQKWNAAGDWSIPYWAVVGA